MPQSQIFQGFEGCAIANGSTESHQIVQMNYFPLHLNTVRVRVAMSVKKSMSIRLPESLADQLKHKASEEGVSVTEMINRFTRLGLRYTAEDRFSPFVG
ncbi:MAG: CopG family transcriptional regulator, partial [Pseudomonadota bacterium]